MKQEESILEKAHNIIYGEGDRTEDYGSFNDSMAKAARVASELCNKEITTEDFFKCMIALKMSRLAYSTKEDTFVDAAGYLTGLKDFVDFQEAKEFEVIIDKQDE